MRGGGISVRGGDEFIHCSHRAVFRWRHGYQSGDQNGSDGISAFEFQQLRYRRRDLLYYQHSYFFAGLCQIGQEVFCEDADHGYVHDLVLVRDSGDGDRKGRHGFLYGGGHHFRRRYRYCPADGLLQRRHGCGRADAGKVEEGFQRRKGKLADEPCAVRDLLHLV